jgi:polyphosphate kinase
MQPKVFISYSWSSQAHQSRIRQWAEQLVDDGIDVVLDIFDLKEGHDKFSFMEKRNKGTVEFFLPH